MRTLKRVYVTGLGQVSSLGTDVASFVQRVLQARPGVSRLPLDCPGLVDPIGASIPPEGLKRFGDARGFPGASLASQYALAAASQAFEAARLERVERLRGGVYVGSGFGGLATCEDTYRGCFTRPGARPRPMTIPVAMANAAAGLLATEFQLKGPNLTFSVACASATHAIGQAFRLLRSGEADLMLAGGTDAPLTEIILASWNAMRVLAPAGDDPLTACRPFDASRQGLVVAEAAAFLVLETEEHAARRGAPQLAEVIGYGSNSDAGHMTHPDRDGVRRSMELALADAGIEPAAVGYVNAHGTGTAVNDRIESEALAELFGSHARQLMVSSTKAVHGHAMGASGALEAIASIAVLLEGRVPPTANLREVDPELPALDFVLGESRKASVDVTLTNSFAFGGNNAVLALRRA